jgi:hypothetical protein
MNELTQLRSIEKGQMCRFDLILEEGGKRNASGFKITRSWKRKIMRAVRVIESKKSKEENFFIKMVSYGSQRS